MIIGIGVDTVNIERFERIVTETPAFVRRVFTASERTLPSRTVRRERSPRQSSRRTRRA